MELNGLALDEFRLESLNTETVKCRCTVEQHGMSLHHILEDVPDDGLAAVDDFLGALHRLHDAALYELAYDERLVELCSHEFGKSALTHLQLRSYYDDRTGRVVDTLTEQVLAEASLLALEGVGERLERSVRLALHRAAFARVVEEAVDGLLEHTFLVAENHLRCLDLHEPLQAVVTDDNAAVEVIEVGSGESSAVERHERAELRRCDGNDFHNHPLRAVLLLVAAESLHHLQALQGLTLPHLRGVGVGTSAQFLGQFVKVERCEEVVDGLSTHFGDELVGVGVGQFAVVDTGLCQFVFHDVETIFLGYQVEAMRTVCLSGIRVYISLEGTRLDDDIFLIVDHRVEFFGGQSEQIANLVGQRAEIPDMCHRHHQLDMSGALTAHLLLRHLHAAPVAHDAFVAYSLVLAATALEVSGGTEDAFAEKAVALGFVGTVIDGLGFGHLTIRILEDFFGRCESDSNLREVVLNLCIFLKSHVLYV